MPTACRLPFALALLLTLAPAFAQELPVEPQGTRTGDAWVDRRLDDINRYGARYPDAFVDELVRYQGAPRQLVLDLLERGWPPGDIYYACALGSVAGRPCRLVVEHYDEGEVRDWHLVAQRIGVEAGSSQYSRLKQGLVAAYGRWGRPLEPEASAPAAQPSSAPIRTDMAGSPAEPVTGEPEAGTNPPPARLKRPDIPRRGD